MARSFVVERWWRDERKAFQIASAFGRGTRLSLEILSELRLILRLLRFKRMDAEYAAIVARLVRYADGGRSGMIERRVKPNKHGCRFTMSRY